MAHHMVGAVRARSRARFRALLSHTGIETLNDKHQPGSRGECVTGYVCGTTAPPVGTIERRSLLIMHCSTTMEVIDDNKLFPVPDEYPPDGSQANSRRKRSAERRGSAVFESSCCYFTPLLLYLAGCVCEPPDSSHTIVCASSRNLETMRYDHVSCHRGPRISYPPLSEI